MYSKLFFAMAGIIKRKNKWVAVFRDASGKEVRKSTGVDIKPKAILPGQNIRTVMSTLEAKARIIADEMESKAKGRPANEQVIEALGVDAERIHGKKHSSVPVNAYLKEFLSARNQKAQERDGKAINQFLDYLGERKTAPLGSITKIETEGFALHELERVASGTVGRYLRSLSFAFNQAVSHEIIQRNPFKGILSRIEKDDKQEKDSFTPEQVRRLLKVLPGEWSDMVRVCLYTGGQRLGDIARLKWEQVNMAGGYVAMTTEKTKRKMSTPIITPLKEVFVRREKSRVSEYVFPIAAMKYAQAGDASRTLSPEFTSLLLKHGFIEKTMKEKKGDRRQQANLTFHSLRSTAVTMLRDAGVSADLCRIIVGHDSEEIQRVYYRPQKKDIADTMESFGESLSLD